jgi:hypothetical protein
MVESQISNLLVAGSIPVSRSNFFTHNQTLRRLRLVSGLYAAVTPLKISSVVLLYSSFVHRLTKQVPELSMR